MKIKCTEIGKAKIYLGDYMDYMRDLPNNAFELAIVDPPYGIKVTSIHGWESNSEAK